jgi:hypothetical protein
MNSEELNSINLFIGAPYSENKIISLSYELYSIQKALTVIDTNNDGILYYACHRRESQEKVDRIKLQYPSITILDCNEPLELFLLKNCTKINTLAGFYSSALSNISVLIECKNKLSFKFHELEIADDRKEGILETYKNLDRKCEFEIQAIGKI